MSIDQLLNAAENGKLFVMTSILKQGDVDINACDKDGYSALYLAASNNHVKCVEWLIQSGANLELRDNEGLTPILSAAEQGYFDAVKMLHDHGADMHAKTTTGESISDLSNRSKTGNVLLKNFVNAYFEQDHLNGLIQKEQVTVSEIAF